MQANTPFYWVLKNWSPQTPEYGFFLDRSASGIKKSLFAASLRDLCKTPLFAQFLRQAQILILKILNVFLRIKFSPSLNLNKNQHSSKVSLIWIFSMMAIVHSTCETAPQSFCQILRRPDIKTASILKYY